MSFLVVMLLAAPVELPDDGAVRWNFKTAEEVHSMGCDRHFDDNMEYTAEFRNIEVYLSRTDGKLDDVQLATPDCIQYLPEATRIETVSTGASLETLAWLAGGIPSSRRNAELLTAATAWHGGEPALQALRDLSQRDNERQWKPAMFWLAGHGERGRAAVAEFLDAAYPVERRKHAVMSLAIRGEGMAIEPIRQSALHDASEKVRAEALFGMTLAKAPGAVAFIETAARNDVSAHVRQRAIFSLSQVGNEAAVDALIRIARDAEYGELRREALFWLAQMKSERATDLVARIADSL